MCRLAEINFKGKYISRICYFDEKETMKVCCLFLTDSYVYKIVEGKIDLIRESRAWPVQSQGDWVQFFGWNPGFVIRFKKKLDVENFL